MGGTIEETFRSALCCYLNSLQLKGKKYIPAELLVQRLADKILHNTTPEGLYHSFVFLFNSDDYVTAVTKKTWSIQTCQHCSILHERQMYVFDVPPIASVYFLHSSMTRKCHRVCIECERKGVTCLSCNALCTCCRRDTEQVVSIRHRYPTHFYSNCVTSTQNLRRMKDGPLQNRCCARLYNTFDEMTRLYWQEHCEACLDRVECLLVRN